MIKEIKLRTRNYHIMRIIYFLLIAFALLAINEFGIFQIMKGPIPLTGVWNPEELDRKYVTLDVDRVYGSFGFAAASMIALVVAIISTIAIRRNDHMKYINIFLNNNSKIALTSLELDFNKAKRFKKNIIVGKQFTFYFVNGHTHILNNSQIVWVYSVMRSGKFQNCIIKFTDINKEQKQFAVSKATSKVLLHYYQETQPHMVVGNNRKTKKLYKKDFPGFLDLKYNKAMNNNIDDESEELIL